MAARLCFKRDSKGAWRVRFNRRDMLSFAKLRFQFVSEQKKQDLAAFEALAMQRKESVALRLGDCIVVDNHRVLHGRSGFDPKSGRLIKRLRILENNARIALSSQPQKTSYMTGSFSGARAVAHDGL